MSDAPRKIVRNEISGHLQALFPTIPVLEAYVRDIPKNARDFIVIFTPSESVRRPEYGGEGRAGRPVIRDITIDIIVCASRDGDGVEAADAANDIVRTIEVYLNKNFENITLLAQNEDFDPAESVSCLIQCSYVLSHFDAME